MLMPTNHLKWVNIKTCKILMVQVHGNHQHHQWGCGNFTQLGTLLTYYWYHQFPIIWFDGNTRTSSIYFDIVNHVYIFGVLLSSYFTVTLLWNDDLLRRLFCPFLTMSWRRCELGWSINYIYLIYPTKIST